MSFLLQCSIVAMPFSLPSLMIACRLVRNKCFGSVFNLTSTLMFIVIGKYYLTWIYIYRLIDKCILYIYIYVYICPFITWPLSLSQFCPGLLLASSWSLDCSPNFTSTQTSLLSSHISQSLIEVLDEKIKPQKGSLQSRKKKVWNFSHFSMGAGWGSRSSHFLFSTLKASLNGLVH